MKILFVWDSPEYLRFYDSAIEECAARGHQVAIAVINASIKKPVGLGGLQAYADRVRVLGVVPQHEGVWGQIATGLRGVMDFVRYLHPRFARATKLRTRMKRKVLPVAYRWLDVIPRLPAAAVRMSERALMALEQAIPVCGPIEALLRQEAPDVVLVSPLIDAASEQVDWIKAAHRGGFRSAACIASWDNLTNKGLLRVEPDLVVVWNEAQRREAQEYHYIPAQKVVATGAQLFDRWFLTGVTRDRSAFCGRVGLPDTRPYVLFMGSSSFISESQTEVAFVRRWIAALRASGDPILQRANILVRPHPYNCHAWDPDPLADLPGAVFYPRRGYNPIDPDTRADFYDAIYHSAAVVGINTSAMIEAAIIGRPVLSMLAEEFSGTQEGTIHFHHLLPENGGCVRVAWTLEEHVRQLSERLHDPEGAREEARRFIASFIRPHGLDRPATPIFADAIERLARQPAPAPQPAPIWALPLRPLLIAAAVPAAVVRWVVQPDWLKPARRHLEKLHHRLRKRIGRLAAVASNRIRAAVKPATRWWSKTVVRPLRARRWWPSFYRGGGAPLITRLTRHYERQALAEPNLAYYLWRFGANGMRVTRALAATASFREAQAIAREIRQRGIVVGPSDAYLAADGRSALRQAAGEILEASRSDTVRAILSGVRPPTGLKEFRVDLVSDAIPADSALLKVALDRKLLEIVTGYLGMWPCLHSIGAWLNYPTDAPASTSQLWHRDPEDLKIIKVFIYLEEVTAANGPFTYIPGTQPFGPNVPITARYRNKERLRDEQITRVFPPTAWEVCTGPANTMIIADTLGYHRGGKPSAGTRILITFTYTSKTPLMRPSVWIKGTPDWLASPIQRAALARLGSAPPTAPGAKAKIAGKAKPGGPIPAAGMSGPGSR